MKERNYGVDFLRILSMFMIVILHTLAHGGILKSVQPFTDCYWMAWFLNIVSYCAINCFALISGYVMHNSVPGRVKLLELWIEVAFYSITLTGIMFIVFSDTRSWRNLLNAVLPITSCQYWYLTAYFGMFLLIPVMNQGINHLEKNILRNSLISAFVFMSVMPLIFDNDPYTLNGGFSMVWLCLMYLTGGYIEKYSIPDLIKKRIAFLGFAAAVGVTFLSKVILEYGTKYLLGTPKDGSILVSYTSPTIVASGIFLFILCTKLQFGEKGKRIIRLVAPATLGIYMIHDQLLVRAKVVSGYSASFVRGNSIMLVFKVLAGACTIWLSCILIELLRLKIFRVLRVHDFCIKMEQRFLFWQKSDEQS